jgi:acyl CoA:acetate/3-ketoacid CoA transferase
LDQADIPLSVSPALKQMDARLFNAAPMGLKLNG